MSTASGGSWTQTPTISRSISSLAACASLGGPSKSSSSWIVRIRRVSSSRLGQSAVAADHRELDDVGGRALDDGVDGEALPERAHLVVARLKLGNLAAAAPHGGHVPVRLGLLDRLRHEGRHAGEALEVCVDELLGLLAGDVQPIAEAVVRQPVDDAVVDHLGLRAHARIDVLGCDAEYLGGGGGVHVFAAA